MKNKNFVVSIYVVWILVIGTILFSTIAAFSKMQHWESRHWFYIIGLMLYFSAFVIILSDIITNKIENKVFWIMSVFIFPTISLLVYLIRRNKIIKPSYIGNAKI